MELLCITLVRSPIGYPKGVKGVLRALGLHKLNSTTIKENNPVVQGMINRVSHMVNVVPVPQKGE